METNLKENKKIKFSTNGIEINKEDLTVIKKFSNEEKHILNSINSELLKYYQNNIDILTENLVTFKFEKINKIPIFFVNYETFVKIFEKCVLNLNNFYSNLENQHIKEKVLTKIEERNSLIIYDELEEKFKLDLNKEKENFLPMSENDFLDLINKNFTFNSLKYSETSILKTIQYEMIRNKVLIDNNLPIFEKTLRVFPNNLYYNFNSKFGNLIKVRKMFKTEKLFKKYLNFYEFDCNEEEIRHELKIHFDFIKFIGSENAIKVLEKLYSKEYSIHLFISNLCKTNFSKPKEYADDLTKFILEILNYDEESFFKILPYSNFERVRNAVNKTQRLSMAEIISNSIAQRSARSNNDSNSSNNTIDTSYIPYTLKLNEIFEFSKENIPNFENQISGNEPDKISPFYFTKEYEDVTTIGRRTHCCFTVNGIAGKLIKPAIISPLSGILTGRFDKSNKTLPGYLNSTWFSFVWEYVENNINTNLFAKRLVLDNIEASGRINTNEEINIFKEYLNKLSTQYERIELGYMRNDIEESNIIIQASKRTKKTFLLGYKNSFNSTYDDSKELYTLNTTKKDFKRPRTVTVKRMNHGDYERALYIESKVYGDRSDFKDLYKMKFGEEVIGYIIEDNEFIYGYMFIRITLFNKDETNLTYNNRTTKDKKIKNLMFEDSNLVKSELENKSLDELNLKKVLYIEDIFLQRYKHVISAIKPIKEDIIKYCQENNIEAVTASTNKFSKPFTSKFVNDERIKYIEIPHPESTPIESSDTDFYTKPNKDINIVKLECKF